MNKRLLYILYLCSLLIPYGCSESEYNESEAPSLKAVYLNIYPSQYRFMASADTERGEVESLGTPWEIQSTSSWLTYSPSSGDNSATIQLYAAENHSADTVRTTIDYLRSTDSEWNFQMPITATQNTATAQLDMSPSYLSFNGGAAEKTVEVSANFNWTATTNVDWITLTKNGSRLIVAVKENNSGYRRWANVEVSGKKNASFTVEQQDANVVLSESSLNFENTAGTIKMIVDAESQWTAAASAYWIQISPSSGSSGKSTIEISVSPNETSSDRSGWIYFSVGQTRVVTIPVKQRGLYIETEEGSISFPSTGGEESLHIKSNVSWIVSSQPDWLTVSATAGTNDAVLTLTTDDNNSVSSRSGRLVLSSPGLNIEKRVTVQQNGKEFSVSPTAVEFSDRAGSQNFAVSSDGNWTATANVDWITVEPTQKTGSDILTVSVTENNSESYRRGSVDLSLGGSTSTISVRQQGKYFTVADDDMNFTSKGGVLQLNVSTNDDWTAKLKNASTWVSLSPNQGVGEVMLNITAFDNPSVNERKDTLLVETKNDRSAKVLIYQAARFLSATQQSVLFFSRGGTSEAITIETDGLFEIETDGDWYSIERTSNNVFTVTAPVNQTGQIRQGQIKIKLTDLQEGEMYLLIPVVQIAPGAKFDRQEYNEDIDWSETFSGTLSLNVVGYSSDKSLDDNGKQTFNLVIKGYAGDNWWGNALDGKGILTKYGYGNDTNQDDSTNSNGNIGRNGYGDDTNQDGTPGHNGAFNKGTYTTDNNWD